MPSTPFLRASSHKHDSYSEPILESKDERTFRAERQRALHAGDRRKGKSGGQPKGQRGPRQGYGYAEYSAVGDATYSEYNEPAYEPSEYRSDVGASGSRRPGQEVALSEIIKPGRKRKGVASDFEMIAGPGQVLALPISEGFDDEDEDLYAGWEDVSTAGSRGSNFQGGNTRPTSYAAALSTRR